jgi:hypothetical protein
MLRQLPNFRIADYFELSTASGRFAQKSHEY